MQTLTTGILAHVDAGKTTCIESMLFDAGTIRKAGRVDHQDSFLDYDEMERKRGITIYSKQASLVWKDTRINLLDTPGHADFSAEMERVLSVLDCAIVLVSALDGVQSHTRTIWKCLDAYKVPAFLFINKMDIAHHEKKELLADLAKNLDERIVDLSAENWIEDFAALDEDLLEEFVSSGTLASSSIAAAVMERKAFPVLFGSALKNEGIPELLDALVRFSAPRTYPDQFGARVFKITSDETSVPLVHLKITGGTLKVRDEINGQKVDQIRRYQGSSFETLPQASAGEIVAVKGLKDLAPGDGLGFETGLNQTLLTPALFYELILPDGVDPVFMMGFMRVLMMEDPLLQVEFNEQNQSIAVHLMGAIQKEVLRKKILDKSGIQVEFGPGKIVYKETIAAPVFGYGHFEPLRHYAEVHVQIEPAARNSGISFSSKLSRDVLSLNWQRLILSSLADWKIPGILTGSQLTDVKITLVNGRAHQKHTSGGDFRQAARRAVRQGLMKAENLLLEPYFSFEIHTDPQYLASILYQLETRKASVKVDELENGTNVITGKGPVRTLLNFQEELARLSKGSASLALENDGYDVCQDAQEIIEEAGYDPALDRRNPTGSVFCHNGSGEIVQWDQVEENLHIPIESERSHNGWPSMNSGHVSEQELKKVFAQAGGSNRSEKKESQRRMDEKKKKKRTELSLEPSKIVQSSHLPTCLIVDGYNMIYSWPELKTLASHSLFAAREELISLLVNYSGYKGYSLIVVFDGLRTKGNAGSRSNSGSSTIVYTPYGMSADAYIEKKVHDLRGKFQCIAATSDALIQNSVLSHGARRISARELESAVRSVNKEAFKALRP